MSKMLLSFILHIYIVFSTFPVLESALLVLLYQYADVRTRVVMLHFMESYVAQLMLDADNPYFQESCKLKFCESACCKSVSCKSLSQSWLVATLGVIGRCAHFNVKLLHHLKCV